MVRKKKRWVVISILIILLITGLMGYIYFSVNYFSVPRRVEYTETLSEKFPNTYIDSFRIKRYELMLFIDYETSMYEGPYIVYRVQPNMKVYRIMNMYKRISRVYDVGERLYLKSFRAEDDIVMVLQCKAGTDITISDEGTYAEWQLVRCGDYDYWFNITPYDNTQYRATVTHGQYEPIVIDYAALDFNLLTAFKERAESVKSLLSK